MSARSQPSLYRSVISGEAGAWAAPLRAALAVMELPYRLGVAARNSRFDRPDACVSIPVPVISVGNITTGGTGKTPVVIDIARRLERAGRSPAVVSRGYGSAGDEPNDEHRLVERHCPGAVCLWDPDRVRAAGLAHRQFGADVIVLDDGFQHRRLARALDLVLIDATCPFGYGHVLPRGLLREPLSGLRRAHAFILTRCDQVAPAALARIEARLDAIAPDRFRIRCRHAITDVTRVDDSTAPALQAGQRAVLFAGIGNPAAFRTTVQAAGVEIAAEVWWPDHHSYRPQDLKRLLGVARGVRHDFFLTTEKDAVKLRRIPECRDVNIHVVNVAVEFVEGAGAVLDMLLERALTDGAVEA